ncbi:MAG TPA: NADH-quinone oxidoreductase subunit M [Gemmataceae bacterium]|nr:NADH-quinone oxidoreductase subunit M [Gemmataceae bacterium]
MLGEFEADLVWMSLVIFVPTLTALLLIFVPRGQEEAMRWISLFGTAITLVVSLVIFIGYRAEVVDFNTGKDNELLGVLNARADAADRGEKASQPIQRQDWVARRSWIDRFNIDYYLGTDGISLPLVLLTTVISFLAMIASWNIERFVRAYCMLFLILETGMIGTFLALDFFLFYIFWEVMLLPMYFLIGVWGGPRREYAAIKFFLYTLLGSVFILIALLGFYFTDLRDFDVRARTKDEPRNVFDLMVLQKAGKASGALLNSDDPRERENVALDTLITNLPTFNDPVERSKFELGSKQERTALRQKYRGQVSTAELQAALQRLQQPFFTPAFQYTMFLLLLVGFAIKVPVFPFHTWLPDAHVEAPTPISMILAGILLKMGGYGILRIAYPICPWAAEQLSWLITIFAMINIVYGAFAAMAQTDFKKLVAYSSVSHMGYVLLGIAVWKSTTPANIWSWGMNGAMFQMIAHGITSAGMFFLVGVIYDRAHHRNLDNFRGLYEPMPLYGGISAIIFFAAMGLPGMCGFVGEFMVVLATWDYSKTYAVLAALTVVITAAYILWTLQRVFLGTNPAYKAYPDINLRELLCVVPLVVLSILLGVAPNLLLSWMAPSVTGLVKALGQLTQ